MSLLNVKNLYKKYGKKDSEVKAVNDISFTVNEGEFVAIVGPSGCGKSTLLHMLGGVDRPESGSIQIDGVEITSLTKNQSAIFRRENIGMVYQFYNLIPTLNVIENIILPVRLANKKVDEHELNYLLELLQLQNRKTHLPSELSGGQQQRIALARAVITHPKLILADEPTGNLDQSNSKEVMNYLNKINKEHKQTILMVTHDMSIAKKASRIIVMEDGKIIKDEVNKNESIV